MPPFYTPSFDDAEENGFSVLLEEAVKGKEKEGQEARRRREGTPTQEKTGWGIKAGNEGKRPVCYKTHLGQKV